MSARTSVGTGRGDEPDIAVVIPYFQRQAGILRPTIEAALRQLGAPALQIIVVDDGSPAPVDAELDRLDPASRARVTLVRQPNRGMGPARNAAIDAAAPSVRWIALLDSDDLWNEDHLAVAISALERGYDFYFSDCLRDGDRASHFVLAGFDASDHPRIDEGQAIHEFRGDFFLANMINSPATPSTVVYRRETLADLRFREDHARWEDLLFFLQAARTTTRVAFADRVQVMMGAGNIAVVADWKSEKALRHHVDYGRLHQDIRTLFTLDAAQESLLHELIRGNKDIVCRIVVANGHRISKARLRLLREYAAVHPTIFTDLAILAAKRAFQKLRGVIAAPKTRN